MILDQNDPTGLGLFSRCARNQACKTTKSRPQTAGSAGSRKSSADSFKILQQKRKNAFSSNYFGKQQSRKQRQNKYKSEITPAVGQYNTSLRDKPKLVWDVIKIYQKKNRQMRKVKELKEKIKSRDQNKGLDQQKQKQKTNECNEALEQSNKIQSRNDKFHLEQQNVIDQKSIQKSEERKRQYTSISHRSACMVNMSKTTGRQLRYDLGKNSLTIQTDSKFIDITSLNTSINRIKQKTTKNIYFKKMIGRKQQQRPAGTANMYDCKMQSIKPRRGAQVNFSLNKGRDDVIKRNDISTFSYTHYDYNEYVWKNTSAVFPNTKKNLISFDKQR